MKEELPNSDDTEKNIVLVSSRTSSPREYSQLED